VIAAPSPVESHGFFGAPAVKFTIISFVILPRNTDLFSMQAVAIASK